MNNKLIIVVLLLTPSCNAMWGATEQEVNNIFKRAYDQAYEGFPFHAGTLSTDELQQAYDLLQHRQSSGDYYGNKVRGNDIALWHNLQRLARESLNILDQEAKNTDSKMSKDFNEALNNTSLIYALAKKGLGLELLQSLKAYDNRLLFHNNLRNYSEQHLAEFVAQSSLNEFDYTSYSLASLETIYHDLMKRQNAWRFDGVKDERSIYEKILSFDDDIKLWQLLLYMVTEMQKATEIDISSESKALRDNSQSLYENVRKGLKVELARRNIGTEVVNTAMFVYNLSDTTKTTNFLDSFGIPSIFLQEKVLANYENELYKEFVNKRKDVIKILLRNFLSIKDSRVLLMSCSNPDTCEKK